ncbi:hypothetical protein R6Q59_030684 [Mikania micrantha]
MPSTTILHITFICFLVICSCQHIESTSRGHTRIFAIDAIKDQDFVTRNGPVFDGKQVSACMPKGRRHSSAPSRYANNQALFHSLGCSTVVRP